MGPETDQQATEDRIPVVVAGAGDVGVTDIIHILQAETMVESVSYGQEPLVNSQQPV